MRFLISPNSTYPRAMKTAEQIEQRLRALGHETFRDIREADMVIVVGGDGTVIRAVRELHSLHIPFWSVNCGSLGYLAECEPESLEEGIEQLLCGRYREEKRSLLTGVLHSGEKKEPFFALNEAVLHRADFSRTLHLNIAVDGTPITRVAGDGLILATPTGSTAYNLSAGGPVLLPEAQELVITPICAHSAVCAPIVVPVGHEVSVGISTASRDEENGSPRLTVDSISRCRLKSGDSITCGISQERVSFIKTSEISFYQRLQKKLEGLE